tara:strand:+ start:402 stop:692 length:291 start_codon:yes stop_codon:yes gene_type:complete
MYCPVCDDDFEVEIKCMSYRGGTVDSCGESNSNINLTADCPDCGLTVIADFTYDKQMSRNLMREANEATHQIGYVKVEKYKEKWMTNEEAEKMEDE